MSGHRRTSYAVLVLTLLFSGFMVQSVSASTSDSVSVTASIDVVPSVSVSVCDRTAVFGRGLTNTGAFPESSDNGVVATSEGTNPGEGVFYLWTAQCSPGIRITSNVPANLYVCGTPNNAISRSPDLSVAASDLRFRFGPHPGSTYDDVLTNTYVVPECPAVHTVDSEGEFDFDLHFGLRVDDGDDNGAFSSSVNFTIVPR